jgi:hypothetical protein
MKVLAVAIVVPLRIDTTGYTRVVIVEYAQRRLSPSRTDWWSTRLR